MGFVRPFFAMCAAAVTATLGVSLVLLSDLAQAAQTTYTMKISVPTIHDIPNAWIDSYASALTKDSGGRIKAAIYPASQLGAIPRQIEGTQFGSIQCEVIPPEFMVGIDPQFQVLAAPGLAGSEAQGERLAQDPAVRKLMLGLGANKGLHGVGLFFAEPDVLLSRTPIHSLADFKGKKVRIFASPFQTVAFERLGMTPVAMTLGDVVPGLQEGTIDAAITGIGPVANFHMVDAAKYVTTINQPGIFIIAEVNKKWFDSLPGDLQQVVDKAAAKADKAIVPIAGKMRDEQMHQWTAAGGTSIKLPSAETAKMMKILSSVGPDVSKQNPKIAPAFKTVTEAASRTAMAAK